MDVGELTPVAQDYLKVIWSAAEWGGPPITTKALAARFSSTAANVSVTLRRLETQGLVVYRPYRPAELTALGRRHAVAMVRRHRLLETFLAEVVGYAWDEVHAEAERLEHAVTDDFLDRIDRLLGHPGFDPHGDPIPSPDGRFALPETVELDAARPGSHRVVRVADVDPAALAELSRLGVVPGVHLEVGDGDGGLTLDGASIALAPELRSAVRVSAS
jgi:DtxR family transcriptional regulator, Mn-dependent transcriptional regulator